MAFENQTLLEMKLVKHQAAFGGKFASISFNHHLPN